MTNSYRTFIRDWCMKEQCRLTMLITTNDRSILGDLIRDGDPESMLAAIACAREEDNVEHLYDGIHSYGNQRRDFTFDPTDGDCDKAQAEITEEFMRENGIVFYLRYDLDDCSESSVRIIDLRANKGYGE